MTPEPLMVMGQVELFPVILLRRQQLHGAKYSSGSGGDRSTVTTSYVPFSGAKAQTMGGVTSGGSIWGSTGGGSVSGVIGAGGGDPTDYTGGSETAPDHIYVRCLIRAKP